jgi:hypothetical protein
MKLRRVTVFLSFAALILSGCATPAADSAPQLPASPGKSEAPASSSPPVTARILIDGTGLSVIGTDGVVIERVAYTVSPQDAIATLTSAVGVAPTITSIPATSCNLDESRSMWGEALTVTYRVDPTSRGSVQFVVRSDSRTISGRIAVETPEGFGVGDEIKSFAAVAKNSQIEGPDEPGGYGVQVWYDLDAQKNGALAISDPKTGLITLINAPVSVGQDC